MVLNWMSSRVLNLNTKIGLLTFKENETILEIPDYSESTRFFPLVAT